MPLDYSDLKELEKYKVIKYERSCVMKLMLTKNKGYVTSKTSNHLLCLQLSHLTYEK